MSINKKRGSIALARSLCYQINGAADDSDDIDGGGYGSVDVAEILSAEVVRLQAALAQPEQEPSQWRDMVVVNLVREGINKHKARELADHFAAQPKQEPWREFASDYERGVIDGRQMQAQSSVDKAVNAMTQRKWVGLTDDDRFEIAAAQHGWEDLLTATEAKLKERNG